MKFKNFVSYLIYGFKNKKLHIVSLFINIILLIYGMVEFGIEVINNKNIIIIFLLFFVNVFWQIWSIINDFKEYFSVKHSEGDVIPTREIEKVAEIIKSEKLSNGEILLFRQGLVSYDEKLCEKLINNISIGYEIDNEASDIVKEYIRVHFSELIPFLCTHYAYVQNNRKVFHNDAKLCLADIDYTSNNVMVRLCKGSYYNSYLTNKIYLMKIHSDEASYIYPPYSFMTRNLELPSQYFSNEIGISTIAITSDGYIFLQIQGNHADSSNALIVPSGSGSADWSDYHKDYSFNDIISYATKRELAEETGYSKKEMDKIIVDNKLIGMFRWLNFAGKPEFVSLTKMNISMCNIHPLRSEQEAHINRRLRFHIIENGIIDKNELTRCFDVINNPSCSVPLCMNLKLLQQYVTSKESEFLEFAINSK